MQLPKHVEDKLNQLAFERRVALEDLAMARSAVRTYMIVAILGWGGFVLSVMLDIIESGG